MKNSNKKNVILRNRAVVYRSNSAISVQLINDAGKVLASADSRKVKAGKPVEKALETGKLFATNLNNAKIEHITFDRNGNKYHGQVKALADGIREGGINF